MWRLRDAERSEALVTAAAAAVADMNDMGA